jgi:hypothetical protein
MKTNRLYAFTTAEARINLFRSRLFVVAVILAVLASFLPAASVLAAPAGGHEIPEDNTLEQEWSNKLDHLRAENLFYSRTRFYPADFDDRADLAQVHYYLEKYAFALKQANAIVLNHAGFDLKGQIINLKDADRSVHDLAMYLHAMRGFREKIDEVTP